jgi:hypothetical protein
MTDPADRPLKKALFVTQAPPPFRPLGGSSLPRSPKPTAVLDYLPPNYPASLVSDTLLVIGKAAKKFPVQTLIAEMCKYVITMLKPHYRRAILEKTLRQDVALSEMDGLLRALLGKNCESDSRRYELKNELMRSEEWLRLARAMVQTLPTSSRSREEASQGAKPLEANATFPFSEDYRSVEFRKKQHTLTRNQSLMVSIMHRAFLTGFPNVDKDKLIAAIDSGTSNVRDSWRGSSLWKTLLISRKKGTYRLNLPKRKKKY